MRARITRRVLEMTARLRPSALDQTARHRAASTRTRWPRSACRRGTSSGSAAPGRPAGWSPRPPRATSSTTCSATSWCSATWASPTAAPCIVERAPDLRGGQRHRHRAAGGGRQRLARDAADRAAGQGDHAPATRCRCCRRTCGRCRRSTSSRPGGRWPTCSDPPGPPCCWASRRCRPQGPAVVTMATVVGFAGRAHARPAARPRSCCPAPAPTHADRASCRAWRTQVAALTEWLDLGLPPQGPARQARHAPRSSACWSPARPARARRRSSRPSRSALGAAAGAGLGPDGRRAGADGRRQAAQEPAAGRHARRLRRRPDRGRRGDLPARGRRAAVVLLPRRAARGRSPPAGVAVVCTTSRPESVSPDLRAPGTLDHELTIPLPDKAQRLKVLQLAVSRRCRSAPTSTSTTSPTARPGFVAADLLALISEAGLRAAARQQDARSRRSSRLTTSPQRSRSCARPRWAAATPRRREDHPRRRRRHGRGQGSRHRDGAVAADVPRHLRAGSASPPRAGCCSTARPAAARPSWSRRSPAPARPTCCRSRAPSCCRSGSASRESGVRELFRRAQAGRADAGLPRRGRRARPDPRAVHRRRVRPTGSSPPCSPSSTASSSCATSS